MAAAWCRPRPSSDTPSRHSRHTHHPCRRRSPCTVLRRSMAISEQNHCSSVASCRRTDDPRFRYHHRQFRNKGSHRSSCRLLSHRSARCQSYPPLTLVDDHSERTRPPHRWKALEEQRLLYPVHLDPCCSPDWREHNHMCSHHPIAPSDRSRRTSLCSGRNPDSSCRLAGEHIRMEVPRTYFGRNSTGPTRVSSFRCKETLQEPPFDRWGSVVGMTISTRLPGAISTNSEPP